ncbi:hypothetical protein niasHT_009130 [Heterodera trifolii]|uniref:Uncharacterized protein n=1 Tax=Heterodera trifolii TaxID=157864 RepID=A0ABD2M8N9_9BILA
MDKCQRHNNHQNSLSNDADSDVDRNRARADAISMHWPDKLSPTPPPSATSANAIQYGKSARRIFGNEWINDNHWKNCDTVRRQTNVRACSQYCPCGRGKCVPLTTYKAWDNCCASDFEWNEGKRIGKHFYIWQCSCCGQHFPYVACRICHEVKTLKIPTIGQNSQTRRRSSARIKILAKKKTCPCGRVKCVQLERGTRFHALQGRPKDAFSK